MANLPLKFLLELSNDLSKERDNSNNSNVICLDFAKNVDTVPHKQSIYKLSLHGITENFFK